MPVAGYKTETNCFRSDNVALQEIDSLPSMPKGAGNRYTPSARLDIKEPNMYDEFDDDAFLGPEALLSLHFDNDWEMDHADAMEQDEVVLPASFALPASAQDESEDDSPADLACAEELRRLHRMLFTA